MSIYCKLRGRSVEQSNANKNCPCAECEINKVCSVNACQHHTSVFLEPDVYIEKREQCIKCLNLTREKSEQAKQHIR